MTGNPLLMEISLLWQQNERPYVSGGDTELRVGLILGDYSSGFEDPNMPAKWAGAPTGSERQLDSYRVLGNAVEQEIGTGDAVCIRWLHRRFAAFSFCMDAWKVDIGSSLAGATGMWLVREIEACELPNADGR